MRKIAWIVLALLAIRLLPRALRREAAAARLLTLLAAHVTAMAAANTSKAYGTEARLNTLVPAVGTLTTSVTKLGSQHGTTGTIGGMSNGNWWSDVPNDNNTSVANPGGTLANHYHNMKGHTHNFNVSDALSNEVNSVVNQLNTITTRLQAAGIL